MSFLWNTFYPVTILNNRQPKEDNACTEAGTNACQFSKMVNKSILRLYGKFLSEDGKHVDYKALAGSEEFRDFEEDAARLQKVSLASMSEAEQKAFWLNIYNALVIHGYVAKGVPSGMKDRVGFYHSTAYKIDGLVFSLDDIEHGILRGNRKHPAFFFLSPQFSASDPRLRLSLKQLDPRIHFALVCGARSCPPIRLYTAENLEAGLDAAAKNFLSDQANLYVSLPENRAVLSQIFKWYHNDFASDTAGLLQYIKQYAPENEMKMIGALLASGKPVMLQWATYDWSLNCQK